MISGSDRRSHWVEKDISGCAISGIMSEHGRRFPGDVIIESIANMHERGNGLGGGFAGYGIYPDYADHYAFHFMFDTESAYETAKSYLDRRCIVHRDEEIPTRPVSSIKGRPLLRRMFLDVGLDFARRNYDRTGEDLVVDMVMEINSSIEGAYVFSSGKNMGIFKGVGFPEDIGHFFRLEEYQAYTWIAHGRFPTNTPGWWGGAHPFGLLNWSIVHNGEISSYGINRRYVESFGYQCTLQTDTEVMAYLFDLIARRHNLPLELASAALAAPFWKTVGSLPSPEREVFEALRMTYGPALCNGPFSILVGSSEGMVALNDRIKLRPMVAARKGDMVYAASEEAAIRVVCDDPDDVWPADAGEPIIFKLDRAKMAA